MLWINILGRGGSDASSASCVNDLFMQDTEANEDEKNIGQKPRLLGPIRWKSLSSEESKLITGDYN